MTSRVRVVKLRLRVPADAAERATALRETARDRLVRGVVDALDARVRARLGPEAIVRIARLPVRWRLSEDELADPVVHARLGEELADAVLEHAGTPSVTAIAARPRAGAAIAVFAGAAHRIAVALADLAEGQPAFHHPAPTAAALWQLAIEDGGAYRVAGVIDALVAMGAAATAIAGVPPGAAAAIPAEAIARWPSEIRAWITAAAARAVATPAVATAHAIMERSTVTPGSETPPVPAARPAAADPIADELSPEAAPVPAPASTVERVPTAVGGAAFLLGRALELELGEHLWCAGIREDRAIADAIACLAPPAHRNDPLLAVLGGAPATEPAAEWAVREVLDRTRDTLGAWLARRGDARTPEQLAAALAAVVAALDTGAGALASGLAAALAAVVASRLDRAWDPAIARALVACDGAFTLDPDEIRIELPLATVDVDVRRAGLDADPGWVPWLERRVRVIYVPGDGDVA